MKEGVTVPYAPILADWEEAEEGLVAAWKICARVFTTRVLKIQTLGLSYPGLIA